MKKLYFAGNLVCIAATLILGVIYYQEGGLLLKGLTSTGFVILGLVNVCYAVKTKKRLRFPLFMATGLLFCMVADVVLNLHFIGGALIFAVGHLLYAAAYSSLLKWRRRDWLPCALIALASVLLITLAPFFSFDSWVMETVCIVYALVISCMLGKAAANAMREKSTVNLILLIGSALFYFSDLMLALNVFAGAPKIADTLCLMTYYPAQCVLAHSIFYRES